MRRALTGAVAAALAAAVLTSGAAGTSTAAAPSTSDCAGPLTLASVPQRPGPALRFGITPGVVAGQVGPPQAAKPDDPARDLAALDQLRPHGAPYVLRLNRFFWSDGEAGIAQFLALAHHYTAAGFQVELQLRYQPPAGRSDDIAGWVAWVREVVDRFGPDPGVVGMQVTNEVNFTVSPDSSDGANAGAKDALIQGVEAAKDEARAHGFGQLRIGFNWVYRSDPQDDNSFWTYIAQHGGARFASDLDWVGLDAYPGTLYPPAESPGGYGDGMANALGVLRDCYMPMGGIPSTVPIYVEENGYPTGDGRSEATQLEALREMVGAVNALRATDNVSDYRWFNLRDADTSAAGFQQHYGLLHDDYSPKPAFDAYRQLAAQLTVHSAFAQAGAPATSTLGPTGRRARLRLIVRTGRCLHAPVTVRLVGPGLGRRSRALGFVDGRRVRHQRGHRYRWRIGRMRLSRSGVHRFAVRARGLRLSVRFRVCGARGR